MTQVIDRIKRRVRRREGLKFPLAEVMKTMDISKLNSLEIIDPRPNAPWQEGPLDQVEIIQD